LIQGVAKILHCEGMQQARSSVKDNLLFDTHDASKSEINGIGNGRNENSMRS